MADQGVPTFSAEKNWARVAPGFKGGPFFNDGSTREPLIFSEGWPMESIGKFQYTPLSQPTPIDSWPKRAGKQ